MFSKMVGCCKPKLGTYLLKTSISPLLHQTYATMHFTQCQFDVISRLHYENIVMAQGKKKTVSRIFFRFLVLQ